MANSYLDVFNELRAIQSSEDRIAFVKEQYQDDYMFRGLVNVFHSPQVNMFFDDLPDLDNIEISDGDRERYEQLTQTLERSTDITEDDLFMVFAVLARNPSNIHEFFHTLHSTALLLHMSDKYDMIQFVTDIITHGFDTGLTDEEVKTLWPEYFKNRLSLQGMSPSTEHKTFPASTQSKEWFFDEVVGGTRAFLFASHSHGEPVVQIRFENGTVHSHAAMRSDMIEFARTVFEFFDGEPTAYHDGFIVEGFVVQEKAGEMFYAVDMLDSLSKLRIGIDKRPLVERRMPLLTFAGKHIAENPHVYVDEDSILSLLPDILPESRQYVRRAANSMYECGVSELADLYTL